MTPVSFCIILMCAWLVKCDNSTKIMYKYIDGRPIVEGKIQEICENKTCIVKCCPRDHYVSHLQYHNGCIPKKIITSFKADIDYTAVNVYSIDKALTSVLKTTKNISEPPYLIIHNNIYQQQGTSRMVYAEGHYLLEDGSLAIHIPHRYKRYFLTQPRGFCVDFEVNGKTQKFELVYKLLTEDAAGIRDVDHEEKCIMYTFTAITMLISCFFLLLTFLVYLLLPHLQTIGGRILMAIVFTLATAYLFKAIINLGVIDQVYSETTCKYITTVFYFAILSSFFWMNIMSFNLFWTLRNTRKRRESHRRGENHKFIMYCLYAYGIPLILTTAANIIDNVPVSPDIIKPHFDSCQNKSEEFTLYEVIPVGLLVFSNCVWFLLTTYNIWLTKKGLSQNKESRNTNSNENKFGLYLKLSLIMGVSWVIECIQFAFAPPLWLYIIMNSYNVLSGVTIFFLFVFKKKILTMLCARFNIKSSFVERMQASQYNRTETSRGPGSTKSNISQKTMPVESSNKTNMSTISESCIE